MKMNTLLFIAILLLFGKINAQKSTSVQVEELQNRLKKIGKVRGAMSDYFTKEELTILKTNSSIPKNVKNPLGGSAVFAINNTDNQFSLLDLDSGFLTTISSSPSGFENAGAVDPNDHSTAYVLDNVGRFYSVAVGSGTYTFLGNIPGDWVALEFNPSSGLLYGLVYVGGITKLHTINIAAVSSDFVGDTDLLDGVGLAIDGNGNAYAFDVGNDTIHSLDLTNGQTALIGNTGFSSNFGQGMFWEDTTDTVYLTSINTGNGNALELRSVNVTTGGTTLIGLTEHQVAWSSAAVVPTVSIADNVIEGFGYYPNPSSEVLNLSALNSIDLVTIYNTLGQKIMSQTFDSNEGVLDISKLNAGVYMIKVKVSNTVASFQFIKKE